jgi:tetratricopeptide (TPR) repeat protein/DNA-binding MarR family transcriptional regulator
MGLQTYLPIEILDYIQTHEPPEESPYGISQRELAKALGYHPCSMSRPLADLVRDGLLACRRDHVRDGKRRQLTYRLTPSGFTRLKRETREVPLLSGEIPPPPHPFLGRRDELEELGEFSRIGPVAVFVDGPPGMGKSALVSRHLRRVKRGRVPLWFTIRGASSPRQFVSALSRALAFLGNPQLSYYAQLPRNPVAREVADLAARALETRSLACVVDDMQLAGSDLKAFLSEFIAVLGARGNHQFFIVGQEGIRFDTGSIASYGLTVGGLDRAAAHELTDRQGGLADRFEPVYQSTLGSPLLLKLAVATAEVPADAAMLPTAVVKRLSLAEVRAILPAALANEPLPAHLITEDSGLSPERLLDLSRMGILHRPSAEQVEVLQVVREAVLGRAAPAAEREARLQLARYYGRSHRPEAVRERFLHLVGGEDWKGASHLLDAQQRVVLRLGYSETLHAAVRRLAAALPHGPARVRVLQVEASMLRHHSDYAGAIASLRRAISEATGDARTICEFLLSIVDLHIRMGDVSQAVSEFENARRIGPITRRLQAYFQITQARIDEGHGEIRAAETHYQQAVETARRIHATDLALESIAAWLRLSELTSGPEAALELIQSVLPEARQAGRVDIVFNLRLLQARAYAELGQNDLAETEVIAVRSEAEALGYLNQLLHTSTNLASIAIERNRLQDAAAYAKQAGALAERLGNDLVLGHTLAMLCSLEFRQVDQGGDLGLLDDAIAHGHRSIEVLGRLPPSDSLAWAHAYLAETYIFKKHADKAADHYAKAISIAESLGLLRIRDIIRDELGKRIAELTRAPSGEPRLNTADGARVS